MSITPLLLLVELAFLLFVFAKANPHGDLPTGRMARYWWWIFAYATLVSYLGYAGVYVSEWLLGCFPALWLQVVTVVVCVSPLLLNASLRNDLRQAVDLTPRRSFIHFHMLRLAALGTMLGSARGTFPLSFELLVGVPDLLFACSALWILKRDRSGSLTDGQFLAWNLVGALVIVPAAPIVLQLGLPGPWQVFTSQPDATAVLTFPMSIAPMIGVPLFVLTNLLVAWRTWETCRSDPNPAQ